MSGVKAVLTVKRPVRVVENDDYTAFVQRIIQAAGRRIGSGDIENLTTLAALSAELDRAIDHAVSGLRLTGYSWTEIADRLGVTRQAAHQRWANRS